MKKSTRGVWAFPDKKVFRDKPVNAHPVLGYSLDGYHFPSPMVSLTSSMVS